MATDINVTFIWKLEICIVKTLLYCIPSLDTMVRMYFSLLFLIFNDKMCGAVRPNPMKNGLTFTMKKYP